MIFGETACLAFFCCFSRIHPDRHRANSAKKSKGPLACALILAANSLSNCTLLLTLNMNADMTEFWPAVILLRQNPLARAAFEVVTKNLGISGYGIARQLDKSPALVRDALSSLREKQLISGSAELRDNFTLLEPGSA